MVAFQGMDVEAIRSVANGLNARSHDLTAVVGAVDGLVAHLASVWAGPDAQQFAQWWQQEHKPRLVAAAEAVHGLGQSASNNASEQDHASGGSGSTGHAAGTPAPAAHGSPSAVTPTADTSRVDAFVAGHPAGSRIGDGQCVQVFEDYNQRVVGAPFIGVGQDGGAREFYTRFDQLPHMSEYYSRIPGGVLPHVGDVVVTDATPSNQYGHIAVVTAVSSSGYTIIQQNSPYGAGISETTYAVDRPGVLGFLRPVP